MPTVEDNRTCWDDGYAWSDEGDEWSRWWGTPDRQWHWSLVPRIRAFVPTGTVLEIGPGFGRWTSYLRGLCDRLVVVDISESCIEACRKRFAGDAHIAYHVNDGRSLSMVPDGSVDFVFSFDSLVHAEMDVLRAYLDQLPGKLAPDGVAFLHHSNAGSYRRHFALVSRATRLGLPVAKAPLLDACDQWRAHTVTAAAVRDHATAAGLRCLSQELVNWGTRRLIDAFTVLAPEGSRWPARADLVRNRDFMREARYVRTVGRLYDRR